MPVTSPEKKLTAISCLGLYAMGKTTKPTKTSKSAVIAKKGKMHLVQKRVAVMKSKLWKKISYIRDSAFSWTTQGADQVEANSP